MECVYKCLASLSLLSLVTWFLKHHVKKKSCFASGRVRLRETCFLGHVYVLTAYPCYWSACKQVLWFIVLWCVGALYLFITVAVFFGFRILLDGRRSLRARSLSLCELSWLVTYLRGHKVSQHNNSHMVYSQNSCCYHFEDISWHLSLNGISSSSATWKTLLMLKLM